MSIQHESPILDTASLESSTSHGKIVPTKHAQKPASHTFRLGILHSTFLVVIFESEHATNKSGQGLDLKQFLLTAHVSLCLLCWDATCSCK